jgi:hypothetical protein
MAKVGNLERMQEEEEDQEQVNNNNMEEEELTFEMDTDVGVGEGGDLSIANRRHSHHRGSAEISAACSANRPRLATAVATADLRGGRSGSSGTSRSGSTPSGGVGDDGERFFRGRSLTVDSAASGVSQLSRSRR